MREMPPECEIGKELDYQTCLACKDNCDTGKRYIAVFKRYKNDKWYAKMRREISEIGQR
jgi:hypothetical protein